MNKIRDVAVIVGSLRKESINRKVANALAELVPPSLKLSIIEIGHLPVYNQDGDENPPRGLDTLPAAPSLERSGIPATAAGDG